VITRKLNLFVQDSKINAKIKAIVLWILLFVILYFSVSLRKDKAEKVFMNPVGTVATVSEVGLKTVTVTYSSKEMLYTYTDSKPIDGINVGEQFLAFMQNGVPENILVYYDNPVLDSSKFEFGSVVPDDVSRPWFQTDYLKFSYTVGGKKYSRIQKYYFPENKPSHADNVLVLYRTDNPDIAYLIKKDLN
jgi:hypothetical protein